MKVKTGKDARDKTRKPGSPGNGLFDCLAKASKQMGELSDVVILDVVHRYRDKATKARQSGTKDG